MVMVSKFTNFPDELGQNDELREYELSGSDCNLHRNTVLCVFDTTSTYKNTIKCAFVV